VSDKNGEKQSMCLIWRTARQGSVTIFRWVLRQAGIILIRPAELLRRIDQNGREQNHVAST
jgi:hypothetical protein